MVCLILNPDDCTKAAFYWDYISMWVRLKCEYILCEGGIFKKVLLEGVRFFREACFDGVYLEGSIFDWGTLGEYMQNRAWSVDVSTSIERQYI